MADASLSLNHEVEELVLEQINSFKQSGGMDDQKILESHLRHLRIIELCRRLPRENDQRKGWLS